jgi:hypothetical protein
MQGRRFSLFFGSRPASLLHVAQRSASFDDLLGRSRDECAPPAVAAGALEPELEKMKAGDDLFDAKIRVLDEQIKHHVKEEEEELFPEIESSDMNVASVGKQLADRKMRLD